MSTTIYVEDHRPHEQRVLCPVCDSPTRGRSFCAECRAPTELRFVVVEVEQLPTWTRGPSADGRPAKSNRWTSTVIEDGMGWGGSEGALRDSLRELAHVTSAVRPHWVRGGYSVEVVVLIPGRTVTGSGPTIGAAIDEAASVLAFREAHGA